MALMFCVPIVTAAATSMEQPAQGLSSFTAEAPYVVKKGDTLWGISREMLQDPLLWPSVWDKNKFISDPNRIYPGDQLMVPGKVLAPAPAPVAETPKPEPPKAEPVAAEPPKETVAAPPPPSVAVPVTVEVRPEPPVPPASKHAMVCSPVLIPEDGARVGTGELVKAPDNRVMLSMEDRVLLGVDAGRSLNTGDRLAAVRVGRRVIHPQTGRSIGRILYVLGLLEVTEVYEGAARARISYSCAPITVGDRIAAFAPAVFPEETTPQPARRAVSAAVLDSLRGEALMGLQQIAFVNVGASQGIAPGDVFAMVRPNGPVPTSAGAILPLPSDRLGNAVVIRVADRTATVLVTASSKEIRVGDHAVLSHQVTP
jgi:hypothetical protein